MRGLVRLLLPAVLVAGGTCALGYQLQDSFLQQPAHGELAAATAGRWLVRYRRATSETELAGRRVSYGDCVEGWRPGPGGGTRERATAVKLSDGEQLLVQGSRISTLRGRVRGTAARRALVELAGCPRVLAAAIDAVLLAHRPIHERLESTEHGRLLELSLPTRPTRIVLLVRPGTQRPVAVEVSGDGIRGQSEFVLTPLTPAVSRRFRPLFASPSSRRPIDFPE
jgi:hypothetical protein